MNFTKLFQPIDNSPLIVFRIFFGFLLFAESIGAIFTGWVKNVFIETQFTFSHIGMERLQPLPGNGMYFYYILMGIFGFLVMIGYKYRPALIMFTLMWAGVYYMQKESYNNHYYLLMLVCTIMIFLPANTYASVDTKINPQIKSIAMPRWCSLVMIFQIAIVYFFATVSKLYPDWIDGSFIRQLLVSSEHPAFLNELFASNWFALFISWTGLAFDFLIVPLLLWKPTRTIAFIASLCFHLFNAVILQIGIFPFFALSFIVFFYPPERIRCLFFKNKPVMPTDLKLYSNQKFLTYFFTPYFIIQLLLPIRHHFIKGDVLWTEEGHRLSWRMMLRHRNGYTIFRVVDKKTNQQYFYDWSYLSAKQQGFISVRPDGIWQMAQRIKKHYACEGKEVSVFVDSKVAVNNSPMRTFVNPKTDLASANWDYFFHNDWILLYDNEGKLIE